MLFVSKNRRLLVEVGSLHATNYLTLCLRFQIDLSGIILIRIRSAEMNIFALGLDC